MTKRSQREMKISFRREPRHFQVKKWKSRRRGFLDQVENDADMAPWLSVIPTEVGIQESGSPMRPGMTRTWKPSLCVIPTEVGIQVVVANQGRERRRHSDRSFGKRRFPARSENHSCFPSSKVMTRRVAHPIRAYFRPYIPCAAREVISAMVRRGVRQPREAATSISISDMRL